MQPFWQDSLTTIYLGKSEDILPHLSCTEEDFILTDPPYGLNKAWKRKWHGNNGETRLWGEIPDWDKIPMSNDMLALLQSIKCRMVIWGGNFYPLPPSRCWFVWDKLQSNRGADCELAWTNLDLPTKVFRMSRIDAYFNKAVFKKVHGAEKPVQLGEWCLNFNLPIRRTIDPFMGTGNFLVAARRLKIPSIGIDISETYCEEAKRRCLSQFP